MNERWGLKLWVEGPSDATKGAYDWDETTRGIVAVIVRRTLQAASGLTQRDFDALLPEENTEVVRLSTALRGVPSLPGRKSSNLDAYSAKTIQAIQVACRRERCLVVMARDRDGRDDVLRWRNDVALELERMGENRGAPFLAIEAAEALLLADATAFKRCFGRGPSSGLVGSPEAVRTPKASLGSAIGSLGGVVGTETFTQLANELDLDAVARASPQGFGHFRRAASTLARNLTS